MHRSWDTSRVPNRGINILGARTLGNGFFTPNRLLNTMHVPVTLTCKVSRQKKTSSVAAGTELKGLLDFEGLPTNAKQHTQVLCLFQNENCEHSDSRVLLAYPSP